MNQRLGKQLTPEGGDISSYTWMMVISFPCRSSEAAVYNDTIDHEIRLVEGLSKN
jgi:outer membrane protein insertion porin family